MQRVIAILRHAKAEPPLPDKDDFERALTAQGRGQCADVAGHATMHGFDAVLCSPSRRTRETLALAFERVVMKAWFRPELYQADAEMWLAAVQALKADTSSALIVGHNPGLQDLTSRFSGGLKHMSPGTLVTLRFEGNWKDFNLKDCRFEDWFSP